MNGPYDRQVSASMLAALMSILDIVVLERLHGGAFKQLTNDPAPSWFTEAFANVLEGSPATLAQAFPILDPFLSDAEAFWGRTNYGRLDGEAVVIGGPGGRNLPIVTVALFLVTQKMAMPAPTNEQAALQQKMMTYMTVFMGLLFYKVASGLCLYFIASSLWGIAERKLLPRAQTPPAASAGLATW